MFRTLRAHRTAALAAGAVLSAVALVASVPAQAASTQTQSIKFNLVDVDFGDGIYLGNGATKSGVFEWDALVGGGFSVDLDGKVWLKDMLGDCARMQFEYLDASFNTKKVGVGPSMCPGSNARESFTVNLTGSAPNGTTQVDVSLQVDVSGTFTDVAVTRVVL